MNFMQCSQTCYEKATVHIITLIQMKLELFMLYMHLVSDITREFWEGNFTYIHCLRLYGINQVLLIKNVI